MEVIILSVEYCLPFLDNMAFDPKKCPVFSVRIVACSALLAIKSTAMMAAIIAIVERLFWNSRTFAFGLDLKLLRHNYMLFFRKCIKCVTCNVSQPIIVTFCFEKADPRVSVSRVTI